MHVHINVRDNYKFPNIILHAINKSLIKYEIGVLRHIHISMIKDEMSAVCASKLGCPDGPTMLATDLW
jgi:hypothetical protein